MLCISQVFIIYIFLTIISSAPAKQTQTVQASLAPTKQHTPPQPQRAISPTPSQPQRAMSPGPSNQSLSPQSVPARAISPTPGFDFVR